MHFDETTARGVLLLRALETAAPPTPAGRKPADEQTLWTPEDRAWATRLARETTGAGADPHRFLNERTRHAMQRLLPRWPAGQRFVQSSGWHPGWLLLAVLAGLALGAAADHLGSRQRVELLSLPFLGLVAWNLLVYLWLLLQGFRALGSGSGTSTGAGGWLRRALRSMWQRAPTGSARAPGGSALARAAKDWTAAALPLAGTRAGLLLHLGAAALGAGIVAGLYVRGLGLDYRAGWQSTFLEPAQVHALLSALLAPASALTGITVPDVAGIAALRLGPGEPAQAGAAPWIHLFAATLGLFVVGPRLVLAVLSALRGGWLSQRLPLALEEDPWAAALLRSRDGGAPCVQVLPYPAAPDAAAILALRGLLVQTLERDGAAALRLDLATPTGMGHEDAPPPPPAGATLRLAFLDMAAVPEAESQGRFVRALMAQAPALRPVVVLDAGGFDRRFAGTPARLEERRQAWRQFAEPLGLRLAVLDLARPDDPAQARALAAALEIAQVAGPGHG